MPSNSLITRQASTSGVLRPAQSRSSSLYASASGAPSPSTVSRQNSTILNSVSPQAVVSTEADHSGASETPTQPTTSLVQVDQASAANSRPPVIYREAKAWKVESLQDL